MAKKPSKSAASKRKKTEIVQVPKSLGPQIYTIHERALYSGWKLISEEAMSDVTATLQNSRTVTRYLPLFGHINDDDEEVIQRDYFFEGCLIETRQPFYGDFRDGWCLQIHPSCEVSLERAIEGIGLKRFTKKFQ